MSSTHTRPGLLRRGWQRALDGDRRWGSVEIRPDRFGVKRYRLVVFPPGTTPAERQRIRMARGWPVWGAAAWVLGESALSQAIGPWTALAISTAAVLGIGAAVMLMAGDPRRRVRTMHGSTMAGFDDPVSAATVTKLRILAGRLVDADDALRASRLSPAEHEMVWWQVYDEIGSIRPAAART